MTMQALTRAAPGPAELGWLLGVAATLGLALMVMGAVRMLRLGQPRPTTGAEPEPAPVAAEPVLASATSPDGSRVRVLVVPLEEPHGEPDGVGAGLTIRRLRPYAADIVLPVDPHPPQ